MGALPRGDAGRPGRYQFPADQSAAATVDDSIGRPHQQNRESIRVPDFDRRLENVHRPRSVGCGNPELSLAARVLYASIKPGARPSDPRPDILVSPCDAIVGACGRIEGDRVYQIKGFPYTLADLCGDAANTDEFRHGRFITMRLTSSMYHRFHAPADLSVDKVTYMSGDTWNVNPIALKRVEKLFCKNERAVIHCSLEPSRQPILLVPVAAILVASIRLHLCDTVRHLRTLAKADGKRQTALGERRGSATRRGTHHIPCNGRLVKGQEMGWFEHGSTIILFTPDGFNLTENVREGRPIKAGEAIMRLPRT